MQTSPSDIAGGEIAAEIVFRSDVGLVRTRNEDSALVVDFTTGRRVGTETASPDGEAAKLEPSEGGPIQIDFDRSTRGVLVGVLDGMGGAASGHIASRLAADEVARQMLRGRDAVFAKLAEQLGEAVVAANRVVRRRSKRDRACRGMGTTLTAALLVGENVLLVQVGDSRAYVLRGERLTQLTADQSLVAELVETGRLSEAEAQHHQFSNVILQALGVASAIFPDISVVKARRGDVLMLCSDGVTDCMSRDDIKSVLCEETPLADQAAALLEGANGHGGHDNATVVLMRLSGEALPLPDVDEAPSPMRVHVSSIPSRFLVQLKTLAAAATLGLIVLGAYLLHALLAHG